MSNQSAQTEATGHSDDALAEEVTDMYSMVITELEHAGSGVRYRRRREEFRAPLSAEDLAAEARASVAALKAHRSRMRAVNQQSGLWHVVAAKVGRGSRS